MAPSRRPNGRLPGKRTSTPLSRGRRTRPHFDYALSPLANWPATHEISIDEVQRQLRAIRQIRANLRNRANAQTGSREDRLYPLFAFGQMQREQEIQEQLKRLTDYQAEQKPGPVSGQGDLAFTKMPKGPAEIEVHKTPFRYPPQTTAEKEALYRAALGEISALRPGIYEAQTRDVRPENRVKVRQWLKRTQKRTDWLEAVLNWLRAEGIRP